MFDFKRQDPEFAERFEHFAFDEVVNEPGQQLDDVTRHLAILATLLGCQGIDAFREELPAALDGGVTPVMAKEVIYQAVDYLGMGRVLPFLRAANEILAARGVSLPPGGPGHHDLGGPPGEGRPGPGRNLRGAHAGGLEGRAHQPVAGRQLLRGLLHPHGPGLEAAGDGHLLLPGGPGRLRAPADCPRQGQHELGQRQGVPHQGGVPMPALHWVPPAA